MTTIFTQGLRNVVVKNCDCTTFEISLKMYGSEWGKKPSWQPPFIFSKLIVRTIIVRGESRAMGAEALPFTFILYLINMLKII